LCTSSITGRQWPLDAAENIRCTSVIIGARCFLADLHPSPCGGFVIEANGRSIFHCGDSAYFPGFKEIGERHDVEIALLPIGATTASGREVHMIPEEAVQAFLELGAKN